MIADPIQCTIDLCMLAADITLMATLLIVVHPFVLGDPVLVKFLNARRH